LKTLTGHSGQVNSILFYSNEILASASADTKIKIWSVSSGTFSNTLSGHSSSVASLALLQNGYLASGSWDNTIRIWDISLSYSLYTLSGHSNTVNALVTLNNGYLVSGSFDKNIIVWDMTFYSPVVTWQASTAYVFALAYYSYLNTLASGDFANLVKIWDSDLLTTRPNLISNAGK
jgi:WD40 repeat protein